MLVWTPQTFQRPEAVRKKRTGPLYKMWRSWCDEITAPGKWMVGALLIAGLGTVTVQVPVYQIFCGLATILCVSIFTGFLVFPAVKVDGSLPDQTSAGSTVKGTMSVTNKSWFRPAYDINIGLYDLQDGLSENSQTNTIRYLAAGDSVEIPLSLTAGRRGLFALPPLRAYTSFPFNLFRIGRPIRSMESLLVLPSFHPLASVDIPLGAKYQPGGISITSHIGESAEYIGNREYIPGEPVRRMDFRAWARLGQPVVREYQEEYYCRIALVLDTWVPSGKSSESPALRPSGKQQREARSAQLEAAISLTAAIGDNVSSGEYLVDLFAAGSEMYVLKSERHAAHLDNILEILACVEPGNSDPFENMVPVISDELQNISTVVCVLLGWDDGRKKLMQSIVESGCSLKVIIVSDDDPQTFDAHDFEGIVITPQQIQSGVVESI